MITYYDCQTKKFFGDVITDDMKRAVLGFYHSSIEEENSKGKDTIDLLRVTKTADQFIIQIYKRSGLSNLALNSDLRE